MPRFKEGDRVRIVERGVTLDDRKSNRYYSHMAGLTGIVQANFGPDEVAIVVEPEVLSPTIAGVVKTAVERMREKFGKNSTEEQRSRLTADELKFDANYVLLARESDLVKA